MIILILVEFSLKIEEFIVGNMLGIVEGARDGATVGAETLQDECEIFPILVQFTAVKLQEHLSLCFKNEAI